MVVRDDTAPGGTDNLMSPTLHSPPLSSTTVLTEATGEGLSSFVLPAVSEMGQESGSAVT